MEELKARLKKLINRKGLTVKEFATLIDQKPSNVYSWITPGRTVPKIRDIPEIAEILDTTCEYILTGNDEFLKDREQLQEIIHYQKQMIDQLNTIVKDLRDTHSSIKDNEP